MFTDPMLGAKCVAVDKIVNDTWRTGAPDEVDPFRSPIVVVVGWGISLMRRLWNGLSRWKENRDDGNRKDTLHRVKLDF